MSVTAFVWGSSAPAQSVCERGIEARLREALGAAPRDTLYVTRDYHAMLLPGLVFYRASHGRGFHTVVPRAAVVVSSADTLVVQRAEDLSALWGRVTRNGLLSADHAEALLAELLFQTGQLARGERVLRDANELPELFRRSLDPGADLQRIRPPTVQTLETRTEVVLFAQTADGVSEIRASSDGRGGGSVTATTIARLF